MTKNRTVRNSNQLELNRPRLSEMPGFIPCKLGEHLTDEQHKLVFSGGNRFWPVVMKAALAADAAKAEKADDVHP